MRLPGDHTENKEEYCKYSSEILEPEFVNRFGLGTMLNLPIVINPKKSVDVFALDLFNTLEKKECDVKVEETPFYTAYKYKVNPQYAFTINTQDIDRYIKNYQDVGIYIWVNFKNDTMQYSVKVKKTEGVYYTTALEIQKIPDKPVRTIERRVNDKNGNKANSYVIDVRKFKCLYSSG